MIIRRAVYAGAIGVVVGVIERRAEMMAVVLTIMQGAPGSSIGCTLRSSYLGLYNCVVLLLGFKGVVIFHGVIRRMYYHQLSLWILLAVLVVVSAFFSSSETAMMSLNRYRLRSLARKGDRRAKRVSRLLQRPDRLLGVILLGNTFANILASAVATTLAVSYLGEVGLILSTVVLTIVILIFSEAAPKTLAALHPERLAYPFSRLLSFLLRALYPLVWFVALAANSLLRLFGVKSVDASSEALSFEEFRILVHEASGKISHSYQSLLLRILNLEKVTVEHVMVPVDDVYAICLKDDWSEVLARIAESSHAYVPVFTESLNAIEGVLNVREALQLIAFGQFDYSVLNRKLLRPYFVPGGADLSQQLAYFRQTRVHLAIVVDEYADVQGVITIHDILEEVVGEFTHVKAVQSALQVQKDGSVLVEGSVNILDLNRQQNWHFPLDGPKTLSGLIIERLEMIPDECVGLRIAGYPLEVIEKDAHRITLVKVWPDRRSSS